MVDKGQLFALHSEPEVELFFVFIVFLADLLLKFCQVDDNFVFAGEAADSCHNAEGITDVDCENPVEKSYDKAEFNVVYEPVEPFKNLRVDEKVVGGTQEPPVKGELGADYSFDVAPVFRVVPEADFHADNKNHSGNIFKKSDAECHETKEHSLLQVWIFYKAYINKSKQKKNYQGKAVKGQVRTC